MTQVRVAHLEDHYRREQLVSLIERTLPVVGKHAEVIALYVILCLFWGLILYTAFVGLP